MTKLALVEEIYPTNFWDVPATLRELADAIETGKHGAVGCLAVAMFANELSVFGMGPDSDGASCHIVLCAAARHLEQAFLDHGKDA